jgi:ABC-2 type transport system permease protein
MIALIQLEWLKLRTTPALYVTAAATIALTLVSAVTNLLLTVQPGAPAFGSRGHVAHVLTQPGAVASMSMLILGVLIIAGEYRHRTILGTFLAEPRRARVLIAKLLITGALGAVIAAVTYAVTAAIVIPLYASKGIHQLPLDVTSLGLGTVLSGACYGLLGVALGALARNTVAAIVGGLVWIQFVEVGILESAVPSLARWLPAGAAQALTSVETSPESLSQGVAALVLVGWAAFLVTTATRLSTRRELR